jgi:serine/threonine protein kinase
MSLQIQPGAEPIPGFRLIERLGGGSFGEVWKAEVPGGLLKAMKFVYGEIGSTDALDDGESNRAEQERKSLDRIKMVRHSSILSVERIDEIDGQLIITSELADRTLWDRFNECRKQGLPGLPRDELMNMMLETAQALDFLSLHELQHLAIKPQHLLLLHDNIKLGGLSMVHALDKRGAAAMRFSDGLNLAYTAPECFDGWFTYSTDQYSLAIVYQEMLTGQRPFAGATKQLALQHLQGKPDLSSLPAIYRPACARALSKSPDDRFLACEHFVRALSAAQL